MKAFKPFWTISIFVALAAIFMMSPYGQGVLMAASDAPETEATASMEAATDVAEEMVEDVETAEMSMVERALSQRTMGDPDAPVVIEEFASLSCPHCAAFHNTVMPQLKEQYIDTGKVYFIFTDFPLNAPALEGSLIARCLPESRYFKFLSFLFEKQDDWAFGGQHREYLKQNARLLGLSEEKANECLTSEEIRTGLISNMQEAQKEHEISSTPSFVINGEQVVTGVQTFENFKGSIDNLLEGN